MNIKNNSITIYDISEMSGFSPKTVSRVLNNEKNVSETTAQKIRAICHEYNYTPNRYARNLKSKKDRTVLLSIKITKDFPSTWVQMLIENIGILCLEESITLITEYFYKSNDLANSIINNSTGLIDGVVILYEQENDVRIQRLKEQGIPFIIFEKSLDPKSKFIGNDNYNALYSIYNKMCQNGLTSSLLLLRKPTLVNLDRVNGVKQAFLENHISDENIHVIYEIKTAHDAYTYVKNNLSKNNLPNIIFVSGDERAPGIYKALRELGINVPEDISILGFDNIPLGEHFDPPITTIVPNYSELANEIIKALKALINNQEFSSTELMTTVGIRQSIKMSYLSGL